MNNTALIIGVMSNRLAASRAGDPFCAEGFHERLKTMTALILEVTPFPTDVANIVVEYHPQVSDILQP